VDAKVLADLPGTGLKADRGDDRTFHFETECWPDVIKATLEHEYCFD
jgi:hypothetical protein